MKIGTLLLVIHDIIEDLQNENILLPSGEFSALNLMEDVKLAQLVENRLKQRGVAIQADLDKVINALPLFISLIVK